MHMKKIVPMYFKYFKADIITTYEEPYWNFVIHFLTFCPSVIFLSTLLKEKKY